MCVHVRSCTYVCVLSVPVRTGPLYPVSIIQIACCGSAGTQVEGLYFRGDSVHMYTECMDHFPVMTTTHIMTCLQWVLLSTFTCEQTRMSICGVDHLSLFNVDLHQRVKSGTPSLESL